MTSRPLRVGIISAAWGVHAHLPAWRSVEGVEAVAICTSRQETADAAAAAHGFAKAYGDYRALAADPDIDIIDVGTRPHLRPDMVMKALEGGKHVYAGIPFADTLANARAMTKLQQEKKLIGVTDAYSQWVPALARMKELIEENYLGELWGFSIRFHLQLFTEGQVNVPTYTWFWDKRNGASVLRNLGAHGLNALYHLLGPVDAVTADLRRTLDTWTMPDGDLLKPEVHDHAMLLARLKNGVTGVVELVWASGDGNGFTIAAHGSRGRLEVRSPHFPDPMGAKLYGTQSRGYIDQAAAQLEIPQRLLRGDGVSIRADTPITPTFPMALSMKRMCDAIRGGAPATPDFAQALHVQSVVEAAERSAQTGAWVKAADV